MQINEIKTSLKFIFLRTKSINSYICIVINIIVININFKSNFKSNRNKKIIKFANDISNDIKIDMKNHIFIIYKIQFLLYF